MAHAHARKKRKEENGARVRDYAGVGLRRPLVGRARWTLHKRARGRKSYTRLYTCVYRVL